MKDPQHDLNAPRKWFDLFMKMNGFWAFVAAIFLIVMTVFSLKDYQNAARLADHSEVATATIVDKYSRRSDYKTKYYLSYRLEVERSQYNFKRSTLKWSGKFAQRAKMYPTRTNGYENDKTTELFRPV